MALIGLGDYWPRSSAASSYIVLTVFILSATGILSAVFVVIVAEMETRERLMRRKMGEERADLIAQKTTNTNTTSS
jgi:hypothetical protein